MASINLSKIIDSSSSEFASIADKLQGNILKSHGRDHAWHLFMKFDDKTRALECIKKHIVPQITSAKKQKENSDSFRLNSKRKFKNFYSLSLSKKGYDFLEIDSGKMPTDSSFGAGMKSAQTRNKLKDPATSKWEDCLKEEWHAVLIVANASDGNLRRSFRRLKRKIDRVCESTHVEKGEGIRNESGAHIEHFGYVDGISQPHLLNDKVVSEKINVSNWNPSENLELALVKDPGSDIENSFGSYLVFRKLEQNVDMFLKAEKKLSTELGVSEEYAGAQIVGRFRSGIPLVESSPPLDGKPSSINDFNFDQDNTTGSKCPFHAHIRRTNPRGTGGREKLEDERKRLFVRRGITYGGDSRKKNKAPKEGFGLLFMAYNSNISGQFEFMQSSWANQANNFPFHTNGAGKRIEPHGIDGIIGQGTKTDLKDGQNYFTKWSDDSSIQRQKPSLGKFVTMKGGEYFFTPSIPFLKSL